MGVRIYVSLRGEAEAIPLGFENSVEIAAARRLGEPRNDSK